MIRTIMTKSGNKLIMNDTEGSVKMTDKGGASMRFDGVGNVVTNSAASNVINVGGKEGNPQSLIKADAGGNIMIDGKTSITLKVGDNSITISGSGITASAGKGTIDITALAGALTMSSTGGTMDINTDGTLTITGGPSVFMSSGDTNIM
jgi:hypothetical protein